MTLPPIDGALESGNIAVASTDGGVVRLTIPPDPGGARHWFHFRAGPVATAAPVRIEGLAAATYPTGWGHARLWACPAGGDWREHPVRFDGDALAFDHPPGQVWTAYAPSVPCPSATVAALEAHRDAQVESLGRSGRGREVRAFRFHRPGALHRSGAARRRAWIVAGQHAGEMPAPWFALGLAERLLDRGDATARAVLAGWDVDIVPVANPDGHLAGWQRSDAEGRDLNREWSSDAPAPEVAAIRAAMAAYPPDLCVDVHSDAVLPYVYVDDVDAFAGVPAEATRRRRAFEDALAAATPDFQTARRYPWATTPSRAEVLRMCGPWAQDAFGALGFTLELPTSWYDAAPERGGWSPARSRAFAGAFLVAMARI